MVARRSVSDWPARRAFQTVTIHHTNPTSPPSDSAAPSQIRISMAGFLLGLRTIAPARKRKRCALQALRADELRQFIERFERLEAEKKDLADQQKEVMAEAKARGYDTKVMRKVIALRKRDKDDIAEEEAVLEMYKEALGMS